LTGNIKIKPDLSYQERVAQSILLKEQWQLIQQGTERKLVKIRYNQIFVQNKIHGKVIDSKLILSQSQKSSTNVDTSTY